jgi:Bacterial Ig domain
MFHANRARQHRGADHPIHGGTSAHAARDRPPERPPTSPTSPSLNQRVTVHRRSAALDISVRPGPLLLALAVLTVLGGLLAGTASATSQDVVAPQTEPSPTSATGLPERLVQTTQTTQANKTREQPPLIPTHAMVYLQLDPAEAVIASGKPKAYKATAIIRVGPRQASIAKNPDTYTYRRDVTRWTSFSITRSGSCDGATCTPTNAGEHIVTGTFPPWPRWPYRVHATAVLYVDPVVDHLELEPNPATIELGDGVDYRARAFAKDKDLGEVTGQTVFTISQQGQPPTACQGATCTPTEEGDHTVTGALKDQPTVKGTATLHVKRPQPDRLVLDPNPATIELGDGMDYRARAFAKDKDLGEVTGQTVFSITPSGSCQGATCTPTEEGDHLVTGRLTLGDRTVEGTATLQVTGRQPSILSVTTGSTFPGVAVEIRGNTGSCNRAGTLTFHGIPDEASMNVTADERGDFVARFTVPTGTFPNAYKLELTVDCHGQLQRAGGDLTVINLAPVAVDDSASTTQDAPVAIAVTANDRNPDPGNGYQTLVVQGSSPPHGTIQVQPDGIIVYTPRAGFLGQDQFQYSLCDNVINAAGQADCGIATVIVTVNPGTATTSGPSGSGPSGSGPSGSGPSGTPTPCAPSAGDLRQHLQVTPVKGPGGTKLRITATVDRKLAACPLRLLLGGAPLGPDLSVGSDGSVSTQLPVPTEAIPGSSILRLATTGGQVLDQTSFEILPTLLRRWWQRLPLPIGIGAFLGGALARAAIRRFRRARRTRREPALRAEPHARPSEVTVEPDTEDRPTLVVRLQPHGDAGALTLQEEVPG